MAEKFNFEETDLVLRKLREKLKSDGLQSGEEMQNSKTISSPTQEEKSPRGSDGKIGKNEKSEEKAQNDVKPEEKNENEAKPEKKVGAGVKNEENAQTAERREIDGIVDAPKDMVNGESSEHAEPKPIEETHAIPETRAAKKGRVGKSGIGKARTEENALPNIKKRTGRLRDVKKAGPVILPETPSQDFIEEKSAARTREERRAALNAEKNKSLDWKIEIPEAANSYTKKRTSVKVKPEKQQENSKDVRPAGVPASVVKKSKQENESAAGSSKTERVSLADLTVEDLMRDIFGAEYNRFRSVPEKKDSAGNAASVPATEKLPIDMTDGTGPMTQNAGSGTPKAPVPELSIGSEAAPAQASSAGENSTVHLRINSLPLLFPENGKPASVTSQPAARTKDKADSAESSEEDLRLLLDLGYERELGNAVGFEKIRSYQERAYNGRQSGKIKMRGKHGKFEYESHSEDMQLCKYYAKKRRHDVISFVFSLIFFLIFLVYERSEFMETVFGPPTSVTFYQTLYVLIALLLFVCDVMLSRRKCLRGLTQVFKLSPNDDSLCAVAITMTVLYHILLLISPFDNAGAVYLSPAAGGLSLLALSDLLNCCRQAAAFRVISSRKQKYALLPRISVGGKDGDARCGLIAGAPDSKTVYVRPVGFVRNYFANTDRKTDSSRYFFEEMLLIFAISLSTGLFVLTAGGGSAKDAMRTTYVSFLLCMPVVSLLVTSLPMFFATIFRLNGKGAVVGEAAIYNMSEKVSVVLADSEVFRPMHHERFDLLPSEHPDTDCALIRALLDRVQSPIANSVSVKSEQRIDPREVVLTEIDPVGVCALVGEKKIPMLMGTPAFLFRHGISVNLTEDPESADLRKRLLCVAINGRLTALFLARYRLNDDFASLISELSSENMQILIRSKDPGVHNGLLKRLCPDAEIPVLVQKPLAQEIDLCAERVDATVVALDSGRQAVRTYAVCRRIRRAAKTGKVFQFFSVLSGASISFLLAAFRGTVAISALLVTVHLFTWCLFHALLSYLYLRNRDAE